MKVTLGPRRAGLFSALRSAPVADLLHEPRVAVGIVEREERVVVGAFCVRAVRLLAVLEVEEPADRRSTAGELLAGRLDVADDQVQPLRRAGLAALQALPERDRARRP